MMLQVEAKSPQYQVVVGGLGSKRNSRAVMGEFMFLFSHQHVVICVRIIGVLSNGRYEIDSEYSTSVVRFEPWCSP